MKIKKYQPGGSIRSEWGLSSIYLNSNKTSVSISMGGSSSLVTFHGLTDMSESGYTGTDAFIDITSNNNIMVSVSDVGVEFMNLRADVVNNAKNWRLYFTVPYYDDLSSYLYNIFTLTIHDDVTGVNQDVNFSFEY